jgi:hypothetical protein
MYTFSGVLRDSEEADHPIADSRITVEAAGGASASRSLSRASVVPGGEVVVTIVVSDYGQYGGVVETLPAGFGYESSSLSDSAVRDSGQTVTFLLFGSRVASRTL